MSAVRAYDAYGQEFDLDAPEPEDDDIANTVARVSARHKKHHHALLHKIGNALKKFGKEAWSFFKCSGSHLVTKCGINVCIFPLVLFVW